MKNSNNKFIPIAIFVVLLLVLGTAMVYVNTNVVTSPLKVGEPVVAEEPVVVVDKSDKIILTSPKVGEAVSSPLKISGKARGSWFFEASFPVFLTDWDGLIIASGIAKADGDWMTTEFVPFTAELVWKNATTSYSNKGTLILKKDNPSGMPEHDDALEIPVILK